MKKNQIIRIRGKLTHASAPDGILGAKVLLYSKSPKTNLKDKLLQNRTTNKKGEFQFNLPITPEENGNPGSKVYFISVLDEKEQSIAPFTKFEIKNKDIALQIQAQAEIFYHAQLPKQSQNERLISPHVIKAFEKPLQGISDKLAKANLLQALNAHISNLPLLGYFDDIYEVAEGVIRGRSMDILRFRTIISDMEMWNQKNIHYKSREISEAEASMLFSSKYLSELAQKLRSNGAAPPTPSRILSKDKVGALRIAALRAAGKSNLQKYRFFNTLNRHLLSLNTLDRLYNTLNIENEKINLHSDNFLQTANFIFGFGQRTFEIPNFEIGPGGRPWPDGVPGIPNFPIPGGGGIPGFPIPGGGGIPGFPIPGGGDWPPGPDDGPGSPFGEPIPYIDPCEIEIIRAIGELFERGINYHIYSVEPPMACPGEEITIRGENFEFEGRRGVVLFSSEVEGVQIEATPTFYSSTEIRVIVPEGAISGPLEIKITGATYNIPECGVIVELFTGPSEPFIFLGGETIIRFFSLSDAEHCFSAGDSLSFSWNTSGATEATLTLIGPSTTDSFALTIGEDGSGNVTISTPVLPFNTRMRAVLSISGICGTDSSTVFFSIKSGIPFSPTLGLAAFPRMPFENWHKNIRRTVRTGRPATLSQLVDMVKTVELFSRRIGVKGSGWSYTDCVVSPSASILLETDNLNRFWHIMDPSEPTMLLPGLETAISPTVGSVLNAAQLAEFNPLGLPVSVRDRLVYVEAGIKIFQLNCELDRKGLALMTMGGDKGQSIAGAINTSTHGSNAKLPPIPDCVRAIHLVGPGGKQWWIEPSSNPITDMESMLALKNSIPSPLDPCLAIVYDNDLFNSCLVSMGSAGVVYGYVLETVNAHNLQSVTRGMSWEEAKTSIQTLILDPAIPNIWFLEATVNPTRHTRFTTRSVTTLSPPVSPTVPPAGGPDPAAIAFLSFLFGPAAIPTAAGTIPVIVGFGTGVIATILGAYPAYIARRIGEFGLIFATPPWEWPDRIRAFEQEIEFIERSARTLEALINVISSGGREEEVANLMPEILNVVWQMGLYVVSGREIIDQVQNLFTNIQFRPEGTSVKKNYVAMTDQDVCTTPIVSPAPHSAFYKLIDSREFALPADEILDFADEILALSDDIRRTNDAVIVILNIRFTQRTRSMIGIQQFAKTGYIEVYTVRGLAGNPEFYRRLEGLVVSRNAIPHHGQFPDDNRDYQALFTALGIGNRILRWRSAMDRIANEGDTSPNTFRRDFVNRRNLLRDM